MGNISEKLRGNIQKISGDILTSPKRLITEDLSTAAREVEDGSILRIRVTAATYVAFGPSSLRAVSSSTQTAIELPAAGTYLIAITGGTHVRASAAVGRCEVL